MLISKEKIRYTVVFLVSALFFALFKMVFTKILQGEDVVEEFFHDLSIHYIVVLVMCGACYLLILLLNRYMPYSKGIFRRVLVELGSVAVLCLVLYFFFFYFFTRIFRIPEEDMSTVTINFIQGIASLLPILLVFELLFYFRAEKVALIESEKAKREALLYQYEALRAQINPHFLFNSLNVLSSLIYIHPDNANRFTKSLSQMYRYVLSLNQKPTVVLGEELDFLQFYLFLLEMRFEESFVLNIRETGGYRDRVIIPLTMQLLIENAFKHNVVTKERPLLIDIHIEAEYFTVSNNIYLKSNVDKGGMGLKYLFEQYNLYGKGIEINNDGHVFVVKIPYIKEKGERY